MKTLNKILPIITFTSVATVVAPLATSCTTESTGKSNSVHWQFDFEKNIKKDEITKSLTPYISKITPADPVNPATGEFVGYISQEEADTIYFDQLENEKSTFADDAMVGFYNLIYYETLYSGRYAKYQGDIDFKVTDYDNEKHTISFIINTVCNFEKTNKEETLVKYYINREIEFTNMPIKLGYYWSEVLERGDPWSVLPNLDSSSKEDYENTSIRLAEEFSIDDMTNTNNITWTFDNIDQQVSSIRYDGCTDYTDGDYTIMFVFEILQSSHYLVNNVFDGND